MPTLTRNIQSRSTYELNEIEVWVVKLIVALFAIFSLLPYGLSWDYTGASLANLDGSIVTKLETGSLFLISGILLYRHLPKALITIRLINPFLLLVLLWCIASSIWSPIPDVTLKRAIQLVGILMIAMAIYLAENPLNLLVNSLLTTFMAILLLSVFIIVTNPAMGIDYELGGAWRGALSQKNEMGLVCALCILLWQLRACIQPTNTLVLLFGITFTFLMLVMSKSSTSLMTMLVTSVIFHIFRRNWFIDTYALTKILLGFACVLITLIYVFFMFESRLPMLSEITGPIAKLFGKGTDLTGRTDIWELVWMEINKHPIMGLGYGSFWLGIGSLSQPIIDVLHWVPLQSHNGYLDIINEQGFIGLALVILTLCWQMYLFYKLHSFNKPETAFWFSLLFLTIVTNFTESSLLRGFSLQSILFFLTVVSTAVGMRKQLEHSRQSQRAEQEARLKYNKLA